MNEYISERGELLRIDMPVLVFFGERPSRTKPTVYRLVRFYRFGGDCNGDRTWVVLETLTGRIARQPAGLVHPFLVRVQE